MSEQAPSETSKAPREIHVTDRSARLVHRMSRRLKLWETPEDAALFLASLAVHEGRGPVPDDELGPGDEVIGDLSTAIEGIDHAGELALFKIIGGHREELGTVLSRDLKGLIEAGAEILEADLRGSDPVRAVSGLLESLDA